MIAASHREYGRIKLHCVIRKSESIRRRCARPASRARSVVGLASGAETAVSLSLESLEAAGRFRPHPNSRFRRGPHSTAGAARVWETAGCATMGPAPPAFSRFRPTLPRPSRNGPTSPRQNRPQLEVPNHHPRDPRRQAKGGRLQIGTPAGFKSSGPRLTMGRTQEGADYRRSLRRSRRSAGRTSRPPGLESVQHECTHRHVGLIGEAARRGSPRVIGDANITSLP